MNECKKNHCNQININKMGKTELYASFVSNIVNIASQRLIIIQCHFNDASPDPSNVLQKQL